MQGYIWYDKSEKELKLYSSLSDIWHDYIIHHYLLPSSFKEDPLSQETLAVPLVGVHVALKLQKRGIPLVIKLIRVIFFHQVGADKE